MENTTGQEPVGYLNYGTTSKGMPYYSEAAIIDDYRRKLYYLGIGGVKFQDVADAELRQKLFKVYEGEFGVDTDIEDADALEMEPAEETPAEGMADSRAAAAASGKQPPQTDKAGTEALRDENTNIITGRQEAYALARKLLKQQGAEFPIVTDAMPERRYEGEIIGVAGSYAIMQRSENQAAVHRLARGQAPPEAGKHAGLATGENSLSTVISYRNEQSPPHGPKR